MHGCHCCRLGPLFCSVALRKWKQQHDGKSDDDTNDDVSLVTTDDGGVIFFGDYAPTNVEQDKHTYGSPLLLL